MQSTHGAHDVIARIARFGTLAALAPFATLAPLTALTAIGAVATACSSDAATTTEPSADGGSGTGSKGGTGDSTILVGTFQVRLTPPVAATATAEATAGSTSLIGKVYDGPTLAEVVWETAATSGSCSLLTPRVPFCTTPCGGSAACVENDTCKDYPSAHGAGVVTASGLRSEAGATTFTMTPVVNSYQPPAATKLAYPAFSEGDDIRLDAAGDWFQSFSLQAKGIAPLSLTNTSVELTADTPVGLTWTPPTGSGSSIHVKLDISHHGGSKGKIECDGTDNGALTIDGTLITKLLALGVAGFPTVIVTRESVGSTTIAEGRVDLVVSSDVEHGVVVAGLTSCSEDSECPTGQTCQSDLTCQ